MSSERELLSIKKKTERRNAEISFVRRRGSPEKVTRSGL